MIKSKRKTVTMADISQAVGVSKNAVSLALSDKPGVSDAMRGRIKEAARQLGYRAPDDKGAAQSCIVVVVPEYIRDDGSFYSDIFWSIEHETRKLGYMTITAGLSRLAEKNLALPNVPDELDVTGYLAIGIISSDYLKKLIAIGKPTVCVDIHNSSVSSSCVSSDNSYGGYIATEHLIACGHTRVGFAGPIFNAQSVFERWCGYQQAMLHHRLTLGTDMCILGRYDGFELLDSAAILAGYVEQLAVMPTAWFCAGDMIAIAMLKVLGSRGLRVPDDISIIGFDDLKIAEIASPPLTTIHVDRKMMGKQAVQLLHNQACATVADTPVHIALPCSLVVRQSVRPLTPAGKEVRA